MKLTTGILAFVMATGAAWAQNPAATDNTHSAVKPVQAKQTNDGKAAQTAKPAAGAPAPAIKPATIPGAKPAAPKAESKPAATSASAKNNLLEHVNVLAKGNDVQIEINSREEVAPKVYKMSSPARLVVELPATAMATGQSKVAGSGGVKGVRIGMDGKTPPTTSIVVDLEQPFNYDVGPGAGNSIVLTLHTQAVAKNAPAAAKASASTTTKNVEAPGKTSAPAVAKNAAAPAKASAPAGAKNAPVPAKISAPTALQQAGSKPAGMKPVATPTPAPATAAKTPTPVTKAQTLTAKAGAPSPAPQAATQPVKQNTPAAAPAKTRDAFVVQKPAGAGPVVAKGSAAKPADKSAAPTAKTTVATVIKPAASAPTTTAAKPRDAFVAQKPAVPAPAPVAKMAGAKPAAKPATAVTKTPDATSATKPAAPATKITADEKPAAPSTTAEAPKPPKPEEKKWAMNGKRDPFFSPVVQQPTGSGCSTGKKCLEIGQINVRGVVKSEGGFIAVVTNSLNKAYFLHENDPVFNGYVLRITGDSVVFQETVPDKLGKPLTREVVKHITTPAV